MNVVELVAALATPNAAVLPDAGVATAYLHLGWSVVLAWLGRRWGRTYVAAALAAWAWVPGVWGVSHWLGLAFQSPSIVLVLWCARDWWVQARAPGIPGAAASTPRFAWAWSVALGWILLADMLGWFPQSVYGWGFSSAALGGVAVLAMVPLCAVRALAGAHAKNSQGWLLWPLALLVFVVLRLPTGNVWDAVLDPWLWLVIQLAAVRRWRARTST